MGARDSLLGTRSLESATQIEGSKAIDTHFDHPKPEAPKLIAILMSPFKPISW